MCFKSEQTENRGTDVTGIPKNTPSTLNLNIGSHTHQSVRAAARNEFSAPVESDPKLNLGLEEAFLKACSEMGAEFKQLPKSLKQNTITELNRHSSDIIYGLVKHVANEHMNRYDSRLRYDPVAEYSFVLPESILDLTLKSQREYKVVTTFLVECLMCSSLYEILVSLGINTDSIVIRLETSPDVQPELTLILSYAVASILPKISALQTVLRKEAQERLMMKQLDTLVHNYAPMTEFLYKKFK